jgi:hypothetical protein
LKEISTTSGATVIRSERAAVTFVHVAPDIVTVNEFYEKEGQGGGAGQLEEGISDAEGALQQTHSSIFEWR